VREGKLTVHKLKMVSDTDKKLWKWESFFLDHVRIMVRIPMMLAAPFILTPHQLDAVQVAVSNTNDSNISKLWHKDLSRIAAFDNIAGVEVFNSYGRSFGLTDGAGANTWTLYDEIIAGKSKIVARAAEAVAYSQLWMDLTGNTIGAFLRGTLKGNKRDGQSMAFEIFFCLYYFLEYFLMAMATLIFKALPPNDTVYKAVCFIHALIASVFIIPMGCLGLLLLPVFVITSLDASTLPSRQNYEAITGEDSYTVSLIKPNQTDKVGIRFGANRSGEVVITNIKNGSIAEDSALQIGDIVLSINGQSTADMIPRQAAATLMGASGTVVIEALGFEGTVVDDEATV
jgi:hypothetical protein